MKLNHPKAPFLICLLAVTLPWLYPLLVWDEVAVRDWRQFNSLSWVVSSLVENKQFPLHDPWVCGGLNLLANPQHRILSPTFLYDLLFNPQFANLLVLITHSLLGAWGAFRMFKLEGLSSWISSLGAVLWINSSWFGLHFAEGHIPFSTFQLLPWMWLFFRNAKDPLANLKALTLAGYFILEGGIYPFVFSLLIWISGSLLGIFSLKDQITSLIQNPRNTVLGLSLFSLLASIKLYPVLDLLPARDPELDHFSVYPRLLLTALFSPIQKLTYFAKAGQLGFHEFGLYLGISLVPIIALWKWKENAWIHHWRVFLFVTLWFWMGSGWFESVNPWQVIFQKIPLLNQVHVQSRTWILAFLGYLWIATKSLEWLGSKRQALTKSIIVLALIESIFVKTIPFASIEKKEISITTRRSFEISPVKETVLFVPKPEIYSQSGKASVICDDKAMMPTSVLPSSDPLYKGEWEVLSGALQVEDVIVESGKIRIVNASGEGTLRVNTNDLKYWKSDRDFAQVISKPWERLLLRVNTPNDTKQTIEVKLSPNYLPF